MFRSRLLATTAFVVVGSMSFLVAQSGAVARPVTLGPNRDRNAAFLCTYGAFDVSYFREGRSGGSSFYLTWTHVAVPLKGRGQTVSRIIVKEADYARKRAQFSAGIYGSSAHGKPGNLIAGGTGQAVPGKCSDVTIPITPTKLSEKTNYWLEETVQHNYKYSWAVDPATKHKAYLQKHFSSSYWNSGGFHSSTTPWTKQNSGPWFRLR